MKTYALYSELLGSWTLSIVWNSKKLEKTMLRELGLFRSSGDGKKISTLMGPLERANLNPVILSVIHHCQNPLDSTLLYCTSALDRDQ
jgi:hypothetical protein